MTTKEARGLIAQLSAAFPRQTITSETLAIYAAMIVDLDADVAQAAVLELIAGSRFFPAIAEIRATAAERTTNLPSANEAWLEVEAAIRRFNGHDSQTWTYDDDYSSSVVANAARSLGGVSVMHEAPQLGLVRRDFVLAYSDFRKEAIRKETIDTVIGGACPPQLLPKMQTVQGAIEGH
jgi:hypothetical protein